MIIDIIVGRVEFAIELTPGAEWVDAAHLREDIFAYIVSELGSLERMDKQIRSLMSRMLVRNLANVEHATESLVLRLDGAGVTVARNCRSSQDANDRHVQESQEVASVNTVDPQYGCCKRC